MSFISNLDLQFISGVWKNLCKIFGIKTNLSTAFYQEIDRLSEIANQDIKRHLCIFVNYQQNNWSEKFAIAKFVAKYNESAFTKLSPFFAI